MTYFKIELKRKNWRKGQEIQTGGRCLVEAPMNLFYVCGKISHEIGETGHVTVRHVRLMVADNNCKKGQV